MSGVQNSKKIAPRPEWLNHSKDYQQHSYLKDVLTFQKPAATILFEHPHVLIMFFAQNDKFREIVLFNWSIDAINRIIRLADDLPPLLNMSSG